MLSFGDLMMISSYLPADSEIRIPVLKQALATATKYEEYLKLSDIASVIGSYEIEEGALKMLVDTAETFDQAEEAHRYCATKDIYPDGRYIAARKMLNRATSYEELRQAHNCAPLASDIETEAKRRMETFGIGA